MKKIFSVMAAAAVILSLTACSKNAQDSSNGGLTIGADSAASSDEAVAGGDSVQIPSPWTDYETLSDMEAATGFAFSAPETANGLSATAYRSMEGLAEVDYGEGESRLTLRKGEGDGDVSGVYTTYSEETTLEINGVSVTAGGESGAYMLARWTDGGYSYSVFSESGFDEQALTEIIGAMK